MNEVNERQDQDRQPTRRILGMSPAVALSIGGLLLAGISYWRGSAERQVAIPAEATMTLPPPEIIPAVHTTPTQAPTAPPPLTPPPLPVSQGPSIMPGSSPPRMASYAVPARPAAQPASGSGAGSGQPGEGGGATTVAFAGRRLGGARAGAAIDTSLVLMPGVYSCILDTAVSSERPGPFQCHTDEPIKSPANVPLMREGTVIIGSFQSDVRQGQARIPAVTVTAWTPEGIPVPLGAVVGDELGRTGMPGMVDRHLAERFGGAFMLLFSQGAIDMARSALTQGNGNSTVNLNTGGVQSMASEALRSSIGIPNTVMKHQGERISFFITEPVSFADAIRLRLP